MTIGIFILCHIIASVWWASHITTMLDILQKDFAEMNANVNLMKELYVKKEDYLARIAMVDKEREALWKRIDQLKTQVNRED